MTDLNFELKEYTKYLSGSLSKVTNIVMEKGSGCYLTSTKGEKYLDFVQGIAVQSLGHSHPKIITAVKEQVEKLIHASFNLVNYPTTLKLAKRIAEIAPGDLGVTFFSNGGSEAVDGALKLARFYTKRPGIISFTVLPISCFFIPF